MRRKLSRSRRTAEQSATVPGAGAAGVGEPQAVDGVTAQAAEGEQAGTAPQDGAGDVASGAGQPESPAAEPVDALPEPAAGGSPEAVIAHWRDMVLRQPTSVTARRRLARALITHGEAPLAVEQLELARTQEPEDVGLIVELAQAQTALRRFDAAERELRRALKLQPEICDVHLSLGVISLRRGLYIQADQELKRATELDPSSGSAWYYRAEALNQLSRLDEALDLLMRAAQLQPEQPRSYYLMGILYDKKARPAEAGAMYRKAREVGGA
jgi:tetratricopeptide (TPR) repeat protein